MHVNVMYGDIPTKYESENDKQLYCGVCSALITKVMTELNGKHSKKVNPGDNYFGKATIKSSLKGVCKKWNNAGTVTNNDG